MKTLSKTVLLASVMIAAVFITRAQSPHDNRMLLNRISTDYQTAVNALAMYPKETRTQAFTASKYPELIVRLQVMQKQTNTAFASLLSNSEKDEQEKIWNLTRYPGLVSLLGYSPRRQDEVVRTALNEYPQEIRLEAFDQFTKNYDLLAKINTANKDYNAGFDNLMRPYPLQTVTVFRQLLTEPEVLTLLADNMHMTVVLGDLYTKEPGLVLLHFDSLNTILTRIAAQEANDWEQSMASDPLAKQQYEEAAREYAREHHHQTNVYITTMADPYTYPVNSYNWWFGYPTWYPYAYWRPYPYWYNRGYYTGPSRHMVHYRMPSPFFFTWYWNRYPHHHRYAAFSNHCYRYYHTHRSATHYNPVCRGVHQWRVKNAAIITSAWDTDDEKRIGLFKEYGKLEEDRAAYNEKNPRAIAGTKEYLHQNSTMYPAMIVATQMEPAVQVDEVHTPVAQPKSNFTDNQVQIQYPAIAQPSSEKPLLMEIPASRLAPTAPQPKAIEPVYTSPSYRAEEKRPGEQAAPAYNNSRTNAVSQPRHEYIPLPEQHRKSEVQPNHYQAPARTYESPRKIVNEPPAKVDPSPRRQIYEAPPARNYETPVNRAESHPVYVAPAQTTEPAHRQAAPVMSAPAPQLMQSAPVMQNPSPGPR